nr:hypothetical protein [Tanacetum cinerariifolium]
MAALVISISSNVSVESVGSSFSRVILIGYISIEVLVAPEVVAAAVALPAKVLKLDTHSSSKADLLKSSPPPVSIASMVSPFLCLDNSESEILTAPILPEPSAIVAPSSKEDIPICRLYRTHPGGPCRALTARKSVKPLPSHSLALRTPQCSEAYLCWRSALLSTMYLLMSSESSAKDSSFESSVGPSRKRCRSPVATVISSIHATRALVPSRVDLLPPRKRFRDSISLEDSVEEDIDMDVDVGVDVEDEVEDEVEFSDRGTIEVGVDVVDGIDIPDGMLMPDALERLEQRELEVRSLIAGGERSSLLEQVASLERSNVKLQGTMMMERARSDRFQRRVRFIKSELRQIRRFRYYNRMRFRRLETFAARCLGTMMMERARADRLIVEPVVSSSISVNQIPHYGLNVTD